MSRKLVGWLHPVDGSDQWDGFNDPGIETYAGNPIRNLAREVTQNALDAKENNPVIVRIRLHNISTDTIPDLDEMKINFSACFEASKKESTKAKVFFKNAKVELSNDKIFVLEISDYNTHGMTGPCENGTPYYAFMKAKGQSRKDSDTATGSYGIGKFAPYATSKIRTIFVSTVFTDESGSCHQYTQGKSILMSHDIGGKRKQAVGFWGLTNKCRPLKGLSHDVPGWIQRIKANDEMEKNKGSKLSIIGFDESDNWEELIAVSVAENFFGAISSGQLRIDVNDKYNLEKESICDFLNNSELQRLIEKEQNEPEQFNNSRSYLFALQDEPEVIIKESQMKELGHVQVRILVQEGLPRNVCVLRNGMFISDSLIGLKSFSDFKDFVAVVQCLNDKGNELLRDMEPPKHDNFEPERLPTKKEKQKGNRALKELAIWIREILKQYAKDPVSEVTEIDELKDFFGEEGSDGSGNGFEDINPYGAIMIRAKPIKRKSYTPIISGNEAEFRNGDNYIEGGSVRDSSSRKDGEGGSKGSSGGRSGGSQKPFAEIDNVRAIISGSKTIKVSFTPVKSGEIALRLLQAGADTDYDVIVEKCDLGDVHNGRVVVEVEAGKRLSINVELNDKYYGAVKVLAYEI